jgi:hypothetical protein
MFSIVLKKKCARVLFFKKKNKIILFFLKIFVLSILCGVLSPWCRGFAFFVTICHKYSWFRVVINQQQQQHHQSP